jgi:hypothetical protein
MSDLKNNAPRVALDGIRDGELSFRLATPEPVILDTDTKEMILDKLAVSVFGEGATWRVYGPELERLHAMAKQYVEASQKIADVVNAAKQKNRPLTTEEKFFVIFKKAYPDDSTADTCDTVLRQHILLCEEHNSGFGGIEIPTDDFMDLLPSFDDDEEPGAFVDLVYEKLFKEESK